MQEIGNFYFFASTSSHCLINTYASLSAANFLNCIFTHTLKHVGKQQLPAVSNSALQCSYMAIEFLTVRSGRKSCPYYGISRRIFCGKTLIICTESSSQIFERLQLIYGAMKIYKWQQWIMKRERFNLALNCKVHV